MSGFVSVDLEGRHYEAEYHLDEDLITVYGDRGSEFTKLAGSKPDSLAKILLRRLAQRGEIDPVDQLGS